MIQIVMHTTVQQAVLLRLSTLTRPIVTIIAYFTVSMTTFAKRTTVQAVLLHLTTLTSPVVTVIAH